MSFGRVELFIWVLLHDISKDGSRFSETDFAVFQSWDLMDWVKLEELFCLGCSFKEISVDILVLDVQMEEYSVHMSGIRGCDD